MASGSCATSGAVCGCDGVTHASECDAHAAGVDIDDRGGCTPPTGRFACGGRFCLEGQYCVHQGDLAGFPDQFACNNLPAGCNGTASCSCVARAQCGEDAFMGDTGVCVVVAGGGVVNRCPSARFF